MRKTAISIALAGALSVTACASFKEGDKDTEAQLRKFNAVPGRVGLYVCRENASWAGAGVSSVVFLDNQEIGTLKPNTFVYAVVEEGKHTVALKHDGIAPNWGGAMEIRVESGEVKIMWVGVTGKGHGVLTIDEFDSDTDARSCVAGAKYSVKAS